MTSSSRARMRRTMMAVVGAGALIGAPSVAPITASSASATQAAPVVKPAIKKFANCTALNEVHKGGVAKAGVTDNKVDRDQDGIVCEKG